MKLLVAAMLLALPLAALLAPTASAECTGTTLLVAGQTVAYVNFDVPSRGGPICALYVVVYECSVTTTTDPTQVFTCSSTPLLTL